MYLLSLGSSNLFAKSMCLLLWCLLMSKATFGYLLGYIKASKSKLHQSQSKYSPRTHCGLTHIMYYVMLHHFVQCILIISGFFLQFLEKILFSILRKIFFTFLGKTQSVYILLHTLEKPYFTIHRKKFFKFLENVF